MPPEPNEPTALIDDPSHLDTSVAVADPAAPAGANGVDGNGGNPPTITTEADPAGAPGEARATSRMGPRWIREAIIVVVIAFVAAILLRTFVVQTFYIPTGSMEPTLQIGDRILVNKLAYHLHGIGRGDIVVFNRPPAENCGGPAVNDLVKRVIGLPGETISVSDGFVDINGKRLNESWLPASKQGETGDGPPGNAANLDVPYKIPAGDYYVMGDNRMDSCDSRFWGPIPGSLIVGKVELRVWPLSQFHLF